jgi:hypothetical protein
LKFDGFVKSPSPRRAGISQGSSGVALHPRPVEFSLGETAKPIQQGKSLQRTSMYASFLKIRAPYIWNFLLCRPLWRLFTSPSSFSLQLFRK